jgi:peptide/nickel transport system substrate-binding protein
VHLRTHRDAASDAHYWIVATKAMTRRRGGTSLMSPGTKRTFALAAVLAIVGSAVAVPVLAQADDANVDALMFGSTYAPEKGTSGGSVVIADWQIPDQLSYYHQNAMVNVQVIAATMDQLWTVSSDYKYIPQLAVSIPSITEGTIRLDDAVTAECPTGSEGVPGFEVDLNIRPNLKWSDGETLDLNDYKFTWQWLLDPDQTGLAAGTVGWDLIDRFDVAEDGLTATVHFCSGYAGFYGLFGSPAMPEHYLSQIPVAEAATLAYPVGPGIENAPTSGPFKYASASPSAIELVRNENYVSPWTGDPAYLDRVVYRFFDGAKDGMIAAFLAGEIDVATDMLQGDYAAISGVDPSVGLALIEPAWEHEHFDMNQRGAGPGMGHPALTDANVRMALAHAIDKTALYEAVYPGVPMPEEAPCAPVPPGLFWRTEEGLTCIEYDPELAKTMLDEAGWVDSDGDGIRDKDGVKLSLLHCHTGAGFRVAAGDFIASAFRDIGVELLNTASPETVFAGWNDVPADAQCNLSHGNYDTSEFAWVHTFDQFGNTYFSYHSSQIPTDENGGNGSNFVRLNDPEMDALLDQLKSTTDPALQVAISQDIARRHTEIQAETVLYYRSAVRGVTPKLGNWQQNPGTASDMWNIGDWFLKDGAAA